MEKKELGILFAGLFACIVLGIFLSSTYSSITGAAIVDTLSLPPIPSTPGGAPASCIDNVKNQDETDIDCGGICASQNKKCANNKGCIINRDCASDYCYIERCKIKPAESVTQLLKKEPEPLPEKPVQVIALGPPSTVPRTPNTYAISIEKLNGRLAFVPNKVDAIVGDIIIWTNKDNAAHQPVTPDRSVEGEKLASGQSWSFTLISSGEKIFHDDLNPSTQGLYHDFKVTILVQPWSGTCDDNQKNLDETDTDCGGHCPSCKLDKACKTNTDCSTGICRDKLCANPLPVSCSDTIKNQDESDVDCGGMCGKCADGKGCKAAADCQSSFCSKGSLCLTPSCTDGEKNQDELDVDCGGKCRRCQQGNACTQNKDCITDFCSNGICDIKTIEIQMTAKQFEFIPNIIKVEKGNRVRINVTSIDVPHGFSLPAFNILNELQPKLSQQIEFIADKAGEFEFLCHVYCGQGHRAMRGKLIVVEKKEVPMKIAEEAPVFEEKPVTLAKPAKTWWWLIPVLLVIGGIGIYLYQQQNLPMPAKAPDFVQEYIKTMRKKGYGDEHIYHQLIQHGYKKQEVENYIQLPGEKLEHYVKRLRRLGYTREKIMKELLAAGHAPVEIHDAMERAKW